MTKIILRENMYSFPTLPCLILPASKPGALLRICISFTMQVKTKSATQDIVNAENPFLISHHPIIFVPFVSAVARVAKVAGDLMLTNKVG